MKLTTFLLLVSFTGFAATGYSQPEKVTIQLKDASMKDLFNKVEQQTSYKFLYRDDAVENILVNLDEVDKPLDNILNKILDGSRFTYKILANDLIVIAPRELLQQQKITGTVTDQKGAPLPGVTVLVKGTATGITTGVDGKYSLDIPIDAKTLVFSFIGMSTQEAQISGRTIIDVIMTEEMLGLDEVVVIGYGTQRKVNLTGSITTIKTEELAAIPMPSISQTLMGRSPGLFIKNVNAQPGDATGISMNIRGFGSPLIIIDGVPATEVEFQQLDPNDIENFNVLKDAAAASVYGARAGNGVILVTTKRGGISAPKVTLSSSMQWQRFLVIPEWTNSEQYTRMENLALFNEGLPPVWSDEQIQKFADGSDPVNYPYTDWWNKAIRPYAPQSQQNINVQGGTEKVKYFVSGGYFYQEAMPRADETKNKRYNLRSNIDIALTAKMNLNLDLSVLYQDYFGPIVEMERRSGYTGIMTSMFRARPYYVFEYPDPTKIPARGGNRDPYHWSFIDNVGYRKWDRLNGDAKVGFSYDLPLGLKAKANIHFNKEYYKNKEKRAIKPLYDYDWNTGIYTQAGFTVADQRLLNYVSNSNRIDQQYFLTWNKKFQDHNVSAMAVYELLSDDNEWINASRIRYDFNIDYLFAGPDLDKNNNGSAGEGGRKGIISRINYDYKGKYLAELNARNEASAKFPKETRWGFFPSASLAWRISEEAFMKNSLPFLTNLKLRASYGNLGYDATGSFQYLATYSMPSRWIWDGTTNVLLKGIRADALPNTSITWEKMTTKNIGIDFNLWKNILEGSFDYFYRLRSDVLGSRIQSIPNTVGASMPQVNYAKYDNRGWEFSLNHINKIAAIEYNIGGNISWNREKTVFVDQASFTSDEAKRTGNRIGEWTDNFWGYKSDGLFQTQDEITNWADQDGKNNATILPGDIRYVDYNGDGKITAEDQVIIGRGAFPKLMYGINMSLTWKGFDFAMLWQGAGLYDYNLLNALDYTKYGDGILIMSKWLTDAYVPENPWLPANTTNVTLPRYRRNGQSQHSNVNKPSDYWLINGSYIRLKNLELGYTLPKSLTMKLGIERCKFYVAAYNLLTFSAMDDWIDPEIDTNAANTFGDYYPPVGTYNIGLTLQF